MRLRQSVGVGLALLTAGWVTAACSSSTRSPYLFTTSFEDAGDGDASAPTDIVVVPDAGVPRCSVPTAAVCDCVEVPLAAEPPNLYFVLDRSGSMAQDNRWSNVLKSVLELVRVLGPRAKFGATLFPSVINNSCSVGTEVMSIRAGDAPAGTRGPTYNFLAARTSSSTPQGGTPTGATLDAVRTRLLNQPGKTFVILATDGGPNCNDSATCDAQACIPNIEAFPSCSPNGPSCCASPVGSAENCLDANATEAAVAALRTAGIPTYVVGIPGSAPYTALLTRLAAAGNTTRTDSADPYYRVDAQGQTALLAAMRKVVAKILATCTISLNREPEDPTRLNVYLDEKAVPQEPLNGWTYADKTVTLVGNTCAKVLAGDVVDLRVIAGCPTETAR
jgi:von Willebrand factor type A domain